MGFWKSSGYKDAYTQPLPDAYIDSKLRKKMVSAMADKGIKRLTDEQIRSLCPADYGSTVTDDHRSLAWDRIWEELNQLDDYQLSIQYAQMIEPNSREAQAFSNPLGITNGVRNEDSD